MKRFRPKIKIIAFSIVLCIIIFSSIIIAKNFNKKPVSYDEIEPNHNNYEALELNKDDIYKGELLLVNSKHPYRFIEDIELISIYDEKGSYYNVKDTKTSVRRNAMDALNLLLKDFHDKYDNNKVNVISGHRTYDFQAALLEDRIEKNEQDAKDWVAEPGGSEHHTGLAVDFSIFNRKDGSSEPYKGKGDYKWINENSYNYGFVVRYPENKKKITGISYEPWHFRYVGFPHAYIISQNDFCLEEYIDFLKDYEYNKKHLSLEFKGKDYEIYYNKGKKVFVPKDYDYNISGNNIDGFIITVVK